MKARHRHAIELLLRHSDTAVAEMLQIRLPTLRSWMKIEGFTEALRDREREQESSARRIARQAVMACAVALTQLAATDSENKPDPKILLEVLKASGVFEAKVEDSGETLAEVMRQIHQDMEDDYAL